MYFTSNYAHDAHDVLPVLVPLRQRRYIASATFDGRECAGDSPPDDTSSPM